jgi:serine/threonine protein phosphatase PrpC
MLIQQENKPSITSHQTSLSTLSSAEEQVNVRQAALELQVGSALDPGIERKQDPNEDTLSVIHGIISSTPSKLFTLMIVADGMGGLAHGQEASRLAVQSLSKYIMASLRTKQEWPETFIPLLQEGVEHANQVIYQRKKQLRTNMGTTITVALVVDNTAYIAHVGDSRLYLYRKPDGLLQITQDHSLVAALVAAGAIQPEDIYTHPSRNIIYRCLGERATVEVDTYSFTLADGDILLLCSDGLWEMVRDQQIAAILASPTPDPFDTAQALIQAALAGGGEDNISAIVARVSEVESHPV